MLSRCADFPIADEMKPSKAGGVFLPMMSVFIGIEIRDTS